VMGGYSLANLSDISFNLSQTRPSDAHLHACFLIVV